MDILSTDEGLALWLMFAGALLLVVGFLGLVFRKNKELEPKRASSESTTAPAAFEGASPRSDQSEEEMIKRPGEWERPKYISNELKTRKVEGQEVRTDHATAEKAPASNREGLKAERLARDAIEPPTPPNKKKLRPKAKE